MQSALLPRNAKGPAPDADPHIALNTAGVQTAARLSTAPGLAGQYSSEVVHALAVLDALSPAGRSTIAAIQGARLVTAEALDGLAPKRVAHLLGVSPSAVRRMCVSGKLGRRVGGRWRVSVVELRGMLAEAVEVRALLAGGRS